MVIIGVTGGIGHGKTTFVGLLAAQSKTHIEMESSSLIIDVANAWRAKSSSPPKSTDVPAINTWLSDLPAILATQLHAAAQISDIRIRPSDVKKHPDAYVKLIEYLELAHRLPIAHQEQITVGNKVRYRPLLQWLGGYLAKNVSGGIWFDEIIRRIQAHPAAELAIVGGVRFPADAKCIKDAGGLILEIQRPHMLGVDMLDVTERERKQIKADVLVDNNGNLTQLSVCARTLWEDIQSGHVQPAYHASIFAT